MESFNFLPLGVFFDSVKVKGGFKKGREVGGGQVSQDALGQLIVSGNVFHLHVYTVNSGRGCPRH